MSSPLFPTFNLLTPLQYGLNSVPIFAAVGGVYLNFCLWALALLPGWLVVKQIGVTLGDKKVEREGQAFRERERVADEKN